MGCRAEHRLGQWTMDPHLQQTRVTVCMVSEEEYRTSECPLHPSNCEGRKWSGYARLYTYGQEQRCKLLGTHTLTVNDTLRCKFPV